MHTIAAIATPNTAGSIAVIRISGSNAVSIAERVFTPLNGKAVRDMQGYTAAYGHIHDVSATPDSTGNTARAVIDDGVLLIFRAPKSYTGEDVAEITCHGGVYVARRVLQACLNAGAVTAEPGEFTKRAVLNGKMTLTQAESVLDVIGSVNEQFLAFANAQKSGALYRRIDGIAKRILSVSAHISAWLDYPEEGVEDFDAAAHLQTLTDCREQLLQLLSGYDIAVTMREGVVTAIVGKPNVGKSTLMNLLTGRERSIVTDIPGTTRDIVEETITLGGVTLRLCDCAGLRADTADTVELIGIDYMYRAIEQSQLVLAVFDNSRPLNADDYSLIERIGGKNVICIINKCDLPDVLDVEDLSAAVGSGAVSVPIVRVCGKGGANDKLLSESLGKLSAAIEELYAVRALDLSLGFVANERQRRCAVEAERLLSQAIENVERGVMSDTLGVLLEGVLGELYALSGENVSEDIVGEVFRQFCVGK